MEQTVYKRKAYTLIELVIVICCFALIAGLGLSQLSFLDETAARMEIDKIASACRYMQQLAIASNEEKYLVFDQNNNQYFADGRCEKLSSRLCFGVLPGIKGPPGSASHTIQKIITFPKQRICFYPTGVISSGTVYLIDKKKQYQYALSNAVSQVSYLRVYRYDGTWKLHGDIKQQ